MKVLVIRLGSLGDVILTTPVVSALKKKYPECAVTVLTKEEYGGVFKDNPDVAEVIELKKDRSSFLQVVALGDSLDRRFDYVVDLHLNLRSFILRTLTGGVVLKYSKQIFRRRLLVLNSYLPSPLRFFKAESSQVSVIENYFKALKTLGVEYAGEKPYLLFKKRPQKSALLGLAPGGKKFTKRWPVEKFAELCDKASAKGFEIRLFGGREDSAVAEKIKSITKASLQDFTGKTDVLETASLMSECSVVVANDSAPMHIASAADTRVIALFCATTAAFGFAPVYAGNKVLDYELPCKPCGLHGRNRCRLNNFECAEKITVQQVLELLK